MSILTQSDAVPSIAGYSCIGLGVLSVGSMLAHGAPVLAMPGGDIPSFAASVISVYVGAKVLHSHSPVAGWLAGGVLALSLAYAGLSINFDQGLNMLRAAKEAAASGATVAAKTASNAPNTSKHYDYEFQRELLPAELKECKEAVKDWVKTEAGQRNCTPATDGKYYLWRKAKASKGEVATNE